MCSSDPTILGDGMVALIVDVDSFEGVALHSPGRSKDPGADILKTDMPKADVVRIEAEAV